MENNFIHLHTHTQYSLLDGAIRLVNLIKATKNYGMDSVAITDHGMMFGVLEFYKLAIKNNVKPILGVEAYVAPKRLFDKNKEERKSNHLVLLAENLEGYKNLCRMMSIAHLEGFYYRPRIDKELLKKHSRGVIALSACAAGEIPRFILNENIEKAENCAREFIDIFGENNFFWKSKKMD